MSGVRDFKQNVSSVMRLWGEEKYAEALAEVERLLRGWPGNARLHILRASLVQLQGDPEHGLDEVKQDLRRAIDLDKESPAGPIELGHFLDAVEDDPRSASRAYAEGVTAARRLLIDGLIGQAKALQQLGKRKELFQCLSELLHLMNFEPGSKVGKAEGHSPDVIYVSSANRVFAVQAKGPHAEQLEEILEEVRSDRSA
jgi:tetratricopeptide (TPR) repeat protein